MQVIQQQHLRRALCYGVQQARHCFEKPDLGGQLILGGGGQIGVAHAQLGQDARKLGQPRIVQQILRGVFLLHPRSDGLDQRLVGQAPPHLEGVPAQHLGALGAGPGRKFAGQPCFADAGLAHHEDSLGLALPRLLKAPDQLAESPGPPEEWGDQLGWRSALHQGGPGRGIPAAASCGSANVLGQGHGVH